MRRYYYFHHYLAQVVKLVDTPDLGSGAVRCVGSSPILGTLPNVFSETSKWSVLFFSNHLLNKSINFTEGEIQKSSDHGHYC